MKNSGKPLNLLLHLLSSKAVLSYLIFLKRENKNSVLSITQVPPHIKAGQLRHFQYRLTSFVRFQTARERLLKATEKKKIANEALCDFQTVSQLYEENMFKKMVEIRRHRNKVTGRQL